MYINTLYLNLTKSDSRCRIPSDSYSNPQNFLSNFDRFESSFPSSFHSFFFSFFFLHTINKFHSVKKRSRNVEVNVSLSLSLSLLPFPLPPPPPRFYFNCRLLGRDEPAHVALRVNQSSRWSGGERASEIDRTRVRNSLGTIVCAVGSSVEFHRRYAPRRLMLRLRKRETGYLNSGSPRLDACRVSWRTPVEPPMEPPLVHDRVNGVNSENPWLVVHHHRLTSPPPLQRDD